ncbi:hypothetical protein B0A48_11441 [Cryoendolithus antarcticus]|uniref:Zn(2)-C6 fungal-type domain-containing protein n=1 Tax=Cryoendolithus antarcticus TaxID=1507870 RepID=A0A1V8SVL6_9PEZI|nr:hypothetical protein B0A48_11441 [Cryoendolithus antarcticus]
MNALPPPSGNGGPYRSNDSPNSNQQPYYAPQPQWYPPAEEYGYDDEANGGNADDGGDGNSRDAKRRRIARACDMCRKKKIKCDGKMPKCGHCENYKTECIFTMVEKKRAPPKGAKYIEGLENRLGRMESLLRLSGLLAEDDGRTDLGTLEKQLKERGGRSNGASPADGVPSPAAAGLGRQVSSGAGAVLTPKHSTPQTQQVLSPKLTIRSNESPAQRQDEKKPENVDALADQMCSLITNQCGETRYIGSASGFSIFSPKGIQWVNEKTGDASFQHMISAAAEDGSKFDHWKPEVFDDLFSRRVFKSMPPKQECLNLLKDFFENFNGMFPLYHEPTFMHLVEKHYSQDPYEGSGWWASLNVALAIAHRLRVMSNVVDQEEDDHAWGYLKNAMAVMSELTMRNTDLLSVQALLGMALFLQGTPNPQPSFFLTAAAIRLSHSIGLHKRGSGFNFNEVENEQRRRVFWIGYLLDKDICLRSGRPPVQDDDDMNVELPAANPPDHVGNIPLSKPTAEGATTMNLFRQMCMFAQIQSRVYKQLYSVKASRQSDGELLNTIGELDQALEDWKDSIPIDFRPEHEIRASHTPLILHVVCLHFAYYNCLTTIHRMSVHHGYWTSRLSDYALQGLNARPLNPRVFMSAALCVNAARTSIGLIRYIPQGDYACVWLVLYYPVSSLVTLFANILQNPQDARARSDLKLMSSVVAFLQMLEQNVQESNGNVRRMLSVCAEFERIAKVVLDKAETDMRGRGKRKQAEREREKDRVNGGISADLEDGKTLEQIQVETQAAYRKPVQTPSLQASMSQPGSGAANSPASWTGSQQGDAKSLNTYARPDVPVFPSAQQARQPLQTSNGQWTTPAYSSPFPASSGVSTMSGSSNDFNAQRHNPDFPLPNTFPSFTNDYSLPQNAYVPTSTPNGASNDLFNTSFQQPFVPQDLWQMPMTLEWDWAEGLGLGSFTPGAMFGVQDGYMGQQPGTGGGENGLYDQGDGRGQGGVPGM